MIKRLQEHWGINGIRFLMVMIVFAITGTLTAWISREITSWIPAGNYSLLWWVLKLIVFLIGYPLILIIIATLLGQFEFFWRFEKKLLRRFGLFRPAKTRIAIFASGAGSNAARIISYFKKKPHIVIDLVVCNRPGAGVINIAESNGIEVLMINRENFRDGEELTEALIQRNIGFIVLAGFLWKVPPRLIEAFPGKIINIHPALLPAYGGKGMYGSKVHEAIISAGERESGITIHYVDEVYDNGDIIFQKKIPVEPGETPASLAEKIHHLEHRHFPKVIEKLIEK